MKAVVKNDTNVGLAYLDVPKPEPKPNEVLIRVHAASICGTDIHYYKWNQSADFARKFNVQFPFIIGHECAGEIVAVGSDVKNRKVGERVALETHIPCGKCFQCMHGEAHNCANMKVYGTSCDGCFAPYAVADEKIAYVLPDEVTYEEGALLAQASGAGKVLAFDMDDYRLNMARKLGAVAFDFTKVNNVEKVMEICKLRGGADVVIETSGSPKAYDSIFDMIRLEGRVVTVGHPGGPVSINVTKSINLKGARIKGIFGRRIWSTWDHLTALMASGKVNLLDVVTHRFAFDQYDKAFDQLKYGAGKILFIDED